MRPSGLTWAIQKGAVVGGEEEDGQRGRSVRRPGGNSAISGGGDNVVGGRDWEGRGWREGIYMKKKKRRLIVIWMESFQYLPRVTICLSHSLPNISSVRLSTYYFS